MSSFSLDKRASGVLLHISSLPGSSGVGDMGIEAFQFARFLREAGQSWWQMFPLGPPGLSNSPYQVLSAFAGNPLFISLDGLISDGLISKSDIHLPRSFRSGPSQYEEAWRFKKTLFRKAFANFSYRHRALQPAFEKFCLQEKKWLDDYALYCALKGRCHGASWEEWEKPYRERQPEALRKAKSQMQRPIQYHKFLQFIFFRQWNALKAECHRQKIGLIGDVPIFVAHDSADVWANPQLFDLDRHGNPLAVAGVPPDYFSRTGQRWGNPLYRWDRLKRQHYDWWIQRFQTTFKFFDAVRLDHFIGFHNYWRIPAKSKTAQKGKWVLAPGEDFFKTVFKRLGKLSFIAEDLGVATPEVLKLRDQFGLPGMRVLQFAFNGDQENPFLPQNFIKNTVVYTGTHDNDTSVGWFNHLNAKDRKEVFRVLGKVSRKDFHWAFIRLALSSVANTAIVPAQDLLGLNSKSRMNMPGTPRGNWGWRLEPGALTPKIAHRLKELTKLYGRV